MDTAKSAVDYYRRNSRDITPRYAARLYSTTVDEMHNAANCLQKHACKGGGCRLR